MSCHKCCSPCRLHPSHPVGCATGRCHYLPPAQAKLHITDEQRDRILAHFHTYQQRVAVARQLSREAIQRLQRQEAERQRDGIPGPTGSLAGAAGVRACRAAGLAAACCCAFGCEQACVVPVCLGWLKGRVGCLATNPASCPLTCPLHSLPCTPLDAALPNFLASRLGASCSAARGVSRLVRVAARPVAGGLPHAMARCVCCSCHGYCDLLPHASNVDLALVAPTEPHFAQHICSCKRNAANN